MAFATTQYDFFMLEFRLDGHGRLARDTLGHTRPSLCLTLRLDMNSRLLLVPATL